MKYFSDETRRRMSESAKRRCTDEWRKNKSQKTETKLDTDKVRNMYERGMTQIEIAKELGVSQKVIWRHMINHNIKARPCVKRNQRGSNNHMWKGDNASYAAFHSRLENKYGKAKDLGCAVCGRDDDEIWYDWANLTGHYEDINDYLPMCRSCHRQYDKRRKEINQ